MADETETYALGLLIEEMGEAIQIVGKWLRFGEGRGPNREPYNGRNAREMIDAELGDVLASIDFACMAGVASGVGVSRAAGRKLTKLLDATSVDAEGKRLAPDVSKRSDDE